ncbi:hypothetical protein [Streptomyces sp. NEAU-W12]|uniref:hypothetical protein n=1 Tax=Streptomyces sp. NEAU-W12 TaxID=2994668 RepID=UPI00224A9011|nr:hypothetical protein [Streptomyces sp. NEAU-W12]MCX2925175.1 hypothetical protein [Streptomyces sp. NEAU-W12]
MEKWRENAQPERSEAEAAPTGDARPAPGGSVTDRGTWFSRDVPGRTARAAGADDATAVKRTPGTSHAAGPDVRADLEHRVAPDDAKARTTTMSATPPPGGTSRMPAQRGPERAAPTHPRAFEDPEETRALRIRPRTPAEGAGGFDRTDRFERPGAPFSARTTPAPPSTGNTGFTARLSTQVPASPRPPRTPLRDPWQEGAEATAPAPAAPAPTRPVPAVGDTAVAASVAASVVADASATEHTHDPHEVTVQLDAVQFGDGVLRATPGRHRSGAGHDAGDGPVFVDETGRRSRLYRRIGLAVGLACAGYAAVIVATLMSGNSTAPWMPVPGQEQEQPAGKVETSPRPAEPDASPSADPPPGTGPTAGDPDAPASPAAGVPAGGVATAGAESGEAAEPSSTPTGTAPEPGTGTGGSATTEPADPPAETETADPPASSGGTGTGTGTDPDTPPAGEGPGDEEPAGTDTVAQAPQAPPAVAAEDSATQPDPSPDPAAPSPEHAL